MSDYESFEDDAAPAPPQGSPFVSLEDDSNQGAHVAPKGDFRSESDFQTWLAAHRDAKNPEDVSLPGTGFEQQGDLNHTLTVDDSGDSPTHDLRGMYQKYAKPNPLDPAGPKVFQPTPAQLDEFALPGQRGFTAASQFAKGVPASKLGSWNDEHTEYHPPGWDGSADTSDPGEYHPPGWTPPSLTQKVLDKAGQVASDTYDDVVSGAVHPIDALKSGLQTDYAGLQGLGGSFHKMQEGVNILGGAGAAAYDTVHEEAHALFPNAVDNDNHKAADWWFKNTVEPLTSQDDAFEVAKTAGLPAKVANSFGSALGFISTAVLTGGEGAALSPTATALDVTKAAVEHGVKSAAIPALSDAVDTGRKVYAETNDGAAALKAAQMQWLVTTAGGVVPMSASGGLAARAAAGAVSGAVSGEAGREAMNTALPADMQTPYSNEGLALESIGGAVMGGVGGHHAADGVPIEPETTPNDFIKASGKAFPDEGLGGGTASGLPGPTPEYRDPADIYDAYTDALHKARGTKDTAADPQAATDQVDRFRAAAQRAESAGDDAHAATLRDYADRLEKAAGVAPTAAESPAADDAPRRLLPPRDSGSGGEPPDEPPPPTTATEKVATRATDAGDITVTHGEDGSTVDVNHQPVIQTDVPDHAEQIAAAAKEQVEERRLDAAQRKKVAEMTPDEMRQTLLTHELTGIPNRRAYEESEKLPVQASIDADSLKWVNDTGGHAAGDEVLKAIGKALNEATPGNAYHAYHLSGDEFTVQGADHDTVDKAIAEARERLSNAKVEFTGPNGDKITLNGIGFSHGKGTTLAEADANLQAEKQQREQQGLRAARGEQPPGASRTPAAQGLPADESRFTPEKRVVKPNERTRGPNPKKDSILQYLARHPRGLDREEAKRQGIDPADMGLPTAHVGIRRAFRKGGISFDHAAETLSQEGYPVVDEDGRYSPNVLLERVSDELAGRPHFSTRNEEHTERLAAAEAEKQQLRADSAEIRSEHEPDVPALVDEPQHIQEWADLANAARKVDPDATDLALEHPDDEVARQKLEEIVARSRPELAEDEAPRQSASAASGNRGEPPLLESYDQAEITRREQAEKDRLAAESEAERKAEADKDREQFALTGSARAADANPGQADLVGFTPQGKTPKPQVGKSAEPKKIDDVGEKIGGARKDRWAERGMDLSDLDSMSEGEAAQLVRKDAVWKPDWAALVAGGMTKDAAALNKVMWDKLAAKPRVNSPAGRRNYLEALGKLRAIMEASKSATDVRGTQEKFTRAIDYNAAEDRYGRSSDPGVIAGRDKFWSIHGGRRSVLHPANPEVRAAKKLIESGFPEERIPWQQKYVIYPGTKDDGSREWRVYEKAGRNKVGTYENEAQAILAARDAYAKAKTEQPTGEKEKEGPPKRPHLDEIKREGLPTVRDGDAKPEDFLKDFGFRGLEFGNWAANDERQKLVNLAYDALHDLAMVLNVPPKALSLNGTLGLALGARGGGFGVAHYEPGKLVINMTKLSGAGSLAHEFGHALDHYFGEMGRPDAYKTDARGATGWYGDPKTSTWAHLRPEMQEAWRTVMDAMFTRNKTQAEAIRDRELNLEKLQAELRQQETRHAAAVERETPDKKYLRDSAAWIAQRKNIIASAEKRLEEARSAPAQGDWGRTRTAYKAASEALSGGKSSGYWRRPTEMFARAFESFVEDKLAERRAVSQYLVHSTTEPHQRNDKGDPYPREDRPAINSALQHLVDTLETRQEGDKIAVFERTKAYNSAQIPLNFDGEPVKATFATRPDTTPAEVRRGLSALVLLRDHRAGATVLGDRVPRAFVDRGTVSLVGQRIGDIHDLALLQQANRRPDFEVLHLILTKGGVVVHHTAASSRLPGAANFDIGKPGAKMGAVDFLNTQMAVHGADGFWVTHNHPSGKSEPSRGPNSDEHFTLAVAKHVPGFQGHVVTNSHEYSTITVSHDRINIETHPIAKQDWVVGESAPRIAHPLLGQKLASPDALMRAMKQIDATAGGVHIFAVSSNPAAQDVRAITWFPKNLVNYGAAKTKAEKLRIVARLRRVGIGSGGSWLFAIADDHETLGNLPPIFQDVMVSGDTNSYVGKGHRFATVGNLGRSRPQTYRVREPEKGAVFYSAVARAVDAAKREKGTGAEWEATLRNMPGVKPEEMEWLGLKDWLQDRGRVTKAEVADYVRAHRIDVKEVMKGERPQQMGVPDEHIQNLIQQLEEAGHEIPNNDLYILEEGGPDAARLLDKYERLGYDVSRIPRGSSDYEGDAPSYANYVSPGGKNYREMLLTLPPRQIRPEQKPTWSVYRHHEGEPVYETQVHDGTIYVHHNPGFPWKVDYPGGYSDGGFSTAEAAMAKAEKHPMFKEDFSARHAPTYESPHWNDVPNVLVHTRFDERQLPTGERALHMAEIQSDWHHAGWQQGYRKSTNVTAEQLRLGLLATRDAVARNHDLGFDSSGQAVNAILAHDDWADRWYIPDESDRRTIADYRAARLAVDQSKNGVPDAPFKTTWQELALKRMLRYAADHGFDALTWDTGQTVSDRFKLSRRIRGVSLNRSDFSAFDQDNRLVHQETGMTPERAAQLLGKDVAERLYALPVPENGFRQLEGLDLNQGSEGKKAVYDKMLPSKMAKIVKPFGGKVEFGSVQGSADGGSQLTIGDDRFPTFSWAAETLPPKLYDQFKALHERMGEYGETYERAMAQVGSPELDAVIRQKSGLEPAPDSLPAHIVRITPAMRAGVSEGLAMFEPAGTYGRSNDDTKENSRGPSVPPSAAARGTGGGKVYDIARRAAIHLVDNPLVMSIRHFVNPKDVSDLSKYTARRVIPYLGELAQRKHQTIEHLEQFSRAVGKLSRADQLAMIHAIETSERQPIPEMQPVADALRKLLDQRRDTVHSLGEGYIKQFIEGYFPHYYKDPTGKSERVFAQIAGRRPMRGPATFLKKRTYATLQDGIEAGLTPLTTNPLILALLKINEMDRFISGVSMMEMLKNEKLAVFFPSHKQIPPEWREIDDPIARKSTWSEAEGGWVQRGRYAMPMDAARIVNNHLSGSLLRNQPIAVSVRTIANSLNALQLGFSAFHVTFTTIDALISKTALGVERLANGEPLRAAAAFGETALGPIQSLMNIRRGYRLLTAYTNPAGATPELQAIVKGLMAANGHVKMDRYFLASQGSSPFRGAGIHSLAQDIKAAMTQPQDRVANITKAIGSMPLEYAQQTWRSLTDMARDYHPLQLPFELAGRIARAGSALIMEHIVPAQKLGVFYDLAHDYIRRNPDADPIEFNEAMQSIWRSVDNRLGEVVYDNKFWNRTFKDALHLTIRAVGFSGGTIEEIGGAPVDAVKAMDKLIRTGKISAADLGHKIPYVMSMYLITAVLSALAQYLLTGKGPEEALDLMFPKTGGVTKMGTPERMSIPSYVKDVYEYQHHFGTTVLHKLNPIWSMIAEQVTNEDYYGNPISNPDHSPGEQLWERIKHAGIQALPFSVQGQQQYRRATEDPKLANMFANGASEAPLSDSQARAALNVAPYMGVNPAPGAVTSSEQIDRRNLVDQETKYQKSLMQQLTKARERGDKEKIQSLLQELQESKRHAAENKALNKRESARGRQGKTSQLIEQFGPLLDQGGSKSDIAARVHAAGYPALAFLIRSMPATLRPQVAAKLQGYA